MSLQPFLLLKRDHEPVCGEILDTAQVLGGQREVTLPPEGGGVVEMLHHSFMTEDGIVLGTLFMHQSPVLSWSPGKWQISGPEVRAIEEYCLCVGMLPVLSVIGEVALVLAIVTTCLQSCVSREWCPPHHDGMSGYKDGPLHPCSS